MIIKPNKVPNGHKHHKLFAVVSQANYKKKKLNTRLKIKNYRLKSNNYKTQYQASMRSLQFITTSKEIWNIVRKCYVSQRQQDRFSKKISSKIKKEFVNSLQITKLSFKKWLMKSCNSSAKMMRFKFSVRKEFKKSKRSLTVKLVKQH